MSRYSPERVFFVVVVLLNLPFPLLYRLGLGDETKAWTMFHWHRRVKCSIALYAQDNRTLNAPSDLLTAMKLAFKRLDVDLLRTLASTACSDYDDLVYVEVDVRCVGLGMEERLRLDRERVPCVHVAH